MFAYYVREPSQYGVVKFDETGKAVDFVEKPTRFLSNWAVTGLYFYDNSVLDIAAELRPSARGELEITDVNRRYMELGQMHVVKLGRGYAWLDTGTNDALLEAAQFVRSIQHRQGLLVGCPEEVAFTRGFITADELRDLATRIGMTAYGRYLQAARPRSGGWTQRINNRLRSQDDDAGGGTRLVPVMGWSVGPPRPRGGAPAPVRPGGFF